MVMKYVIECVDKLYKWNFIEYKHISKIVGKSNLIFTNTSSKRLKLFGKVEEKSVKELCLKKICILDPSSKKTLSPADAKKFDYLIFGGIMGDFPPKKRTRKFFKQVKAERRNLGKGQMPTDNAVYVAKKIIEGTPLEKMEFKNNITIKINEYEEVDLPFTYVVVKGKPLVSGELISYLRKTKEF